MSLPIAVAPSPARSAAPGPRPTGGSAEDFAAAVREAEAPGAEGAQPSNSRPTSSQPTTSQPKDTQVDRADDQTADRIAMGALLGSPDVSAARVPIGILVPDASTDQLLGAGDTTAPEAPAAEDGALSVPMPASAAADAAVSAAASSGAQHVRADAAVAVAAPGQAPGTAAPSTAAADGEASADTAALGAGSMPARGSATAAGGTMPQPGQGEADRGGDADAITGISAPRTPGSPLSAPHGAALTRQGSGAAQVATGTPAVAESAAAPSAATAASAPLSAATAAAAPAAGSARPALLPQLSGPVIALARSPQRQHSITLTVSPENLGPVTVRAHIVGSSIRLELHSPSDAGRDALRVILADLRRDLSVAAPGASVDVSARDSGSSPDPQARPDTGRSETQARADAQARGDQQRAHTDAAEPRHGPRPASVGQTQPTDPTDPSSSHSRIDVYA